MRLLNWISLLLIFASSVNTADADQWGQAADPIAATQPLTATITSGNVTLASAQAFIVSVQNEGSNTAYATCKASTADTPAGGTCKSCIPIPPAGGGAFLFKPLGVSNCAAITASGSSAIDFTPINLY